MGQQDNSELISAIESGAYLVDVRSPAEFNGGSIKGAVNIPLDSVPNQISKFKGKKGVVVFYQAWNEGVVTQEQLAKYHRSYAEFIELMPRYWHKINMAFNQDTQEAFEVVEDELSHIPLWADWGTDLPYTKTYPRMAEVIDGLNKMTPSELLGAIQAFETQQPEVAETKRAGLVNHYGVSKDNTKYFDEHTKEEEHIAYGNMLKEKYANKEEYEAGFAKGAELFYNGLNLFVN